MTLQEKIDTFDISVLPDTIAEGRVYKIHAYGALETDGFEVGFLYLTKDSGIKEHIHTDNIEMYRLLKGDLVVNGTSMNNNICLLNESHLIDKVSIDTIICTCKISKEFIKQNGVEEEFNTNIDKVLKMIKED